MPAPGAAASSRPHVYRRMFVRMVSETFVPHSRNFEYCAAFILTLRIL
jgi:hypothetical protein